MREPVFLPSYRANNRCKLSIAEAQQLERLQMESHRRILESEPIPPELTQANVSHKRRGQMFVNSAILVMLLIIAGNLAFLTAQTLGNRYQDEREISTIREKDGIARISFGHHDGQVTLALLDKAGKSRIKIFLDATERPTLSLSGGLQQHQTELKMTPGGKPENKAPAAPENKDASSDLASKDPSRLQTPATISETAGKLSSPEKPGSNVSDNREAKAEAAAPATKPLYLGSITSDKYHYPDCRWAKTILPQKVICFSSVKEAREEEYKPCCVCRPPSED